MIKLVQLWEGYYKQIAEPLVKSGYGKYLKTLIGN